MAIDMAKGPPLSISASIMVRVEVEAWRYSRGSYTNAPCFLPHALFLYIEICQNIYTHIQSYFELGS